MIIGYLIFYFISYFNTSFLLNKRNDVLFLLIGILLTPIGILIPIEFRSIYMILLLILLFYFNYKNIKRVTSALMFHYFAILIIETVYTLILLALKIDINEKYIFINSIVISLLSVCFIRTKIFLGLWDIIQNKFEKYILYLVVVIFIFIYINISYRYNFVSIFILIVIILVLIYIILRVLVLSYMMKNQTEIMLEYIKLYEKQIEEFRINQHEYTNTLLCVREMVKKNKKSLKYIDSILAEKNNDDHNILKDVLKIQISPIRGLIYSKLLKCKEKGIYFILNVSSSINFKKLKQIHINTLNDVTLILGVLLDNAIEASFETKQKSLSIYLYEKDNKFIFQVSNTFKGTIDIDLLYKINYSTKGKNRGYGLTLVQSKIKENKNLSLDTEISNDVFIQYLKIKLY